MPLLDVTGDGTIDLVRKQLDYTLKVRVRDNEVLPVVPIRVSGSFDDLSYAPQLDRAILDRAAQQVKQKLEKSRESIKEKLNPEIDRLKEKIDDKLKNFQERQGKRSRKFVK